MTIDNYTKVILTVIALSTTTIALKGVGIIPSADAQSKTTLKVAVCDTGGRHCLEPWWSTDYRKFYLPVVTR